MVCNYRAQTWGRYVEGSRRTTDMTAKCNLGEKENHGVDLYCVNNRCQIELRYEGSLYKYQSSYKYLGSNV